MKFYDCQPAPNPRRARIFIAEKGLDIETLEIDLGKGEQLNDDFKKVNPRCTVPVLELDNGECLTENLGIAAYLEARYPDPPLLGVTPEEKGLVATWQSHVELEGLGAVTDAFRNHTRGFVGRAITGPTGYEQIPALAERGRARALEFFDSLDARLGEAEYLAGARYSIADITALCVVDFAKWAKLDALDGHANTKRWYEAVSARPSAKL